MRNQCLRLLLICYHTPSRPHISQVHHLRSFTSSLLHPRAPHLTPNPFVLRHHFTSSPELSVEPPKPPCDEAILLTDIFAKPGRSNDEIKLDLDSKNVVITHDLILSFLKNPDTDPDIAKRVFDWVLESEGEKLSSKSYNWMLGILGGKGSVNETWGLIGIMKKKGYGVSKGAFVRISEKFQNDGLGDDVEKLKELYASGSTSCKKNEASKENAVEMICSTISNMIRQQVWGDDVEKQLKESNVKYSSDLVTRVLENLEIEPNKALIFFKWVQESGLFKHNERSFNVMARILAEEDHSQKFWRFSHEMRGEGHEMERETYVHILERFVKRKMIKDAVDLYEFAMIGRNKPSANDCTFLLKKIVVSKELDMDLFMKVLGVYKANGNVLTDANLDAVIKSLTSVGKMTECRKILLAMEKAGYVPSVSSHSKIAFKLGSGGKTGEAMEFMRNISDHKIWESLVKGCCEARDLKEASNNFREMVEKEGPACAGRAFDVLIDMYCRKNRPMDAYKFVLEMVKDKGVSPWRSSYKVLTSKLLAKKRFKEALVVMDIMKNQDYSPDLDSFVEYLSKKGSADEAVEFAQAMTSKRFPAFSVFVRLIEAYIKAGRQNEAQDFLAKCPRYVKNHASVLNLFCSGKSGGTGNAVVAV
ncbi:pentatricopeptide repeat-containing protein at3g02490 mitochondrial [Phtheirospermum japonicum]|uniref:Pentatricopeptide repeat-containing protein at3g02490 mitochondrial n=1 Tax=Phtheirospermum japonicum TaxID=374723 RepID=A0A830CUK0_9LAMI|nr:pentatricopeptide repeat-containing protein at3g02490 mitochondrial [Phtheirospermum japonicum]